MFCGQLRSYFSIFLFFLHNSVTFRPLFLPARISAPCVNPFQTLHFVCFPSKSAVKALKNAGVSASSSGSPPFLSFPEKEQKKDNFHPETRLFSGTPNPGSRGFRFPCFSLFTSKLPIFERFRGRFPFFACWIPAALQPFHAVKQAVMIRRFHGNSCILLLFINQLIPLFYMYYSFKLWFSINLRKTGVSLLNNPHKKATARRDAAGRGQSSHPHDSLYDCQL